MADLDGGEGCKGICGVGDLGGRNGLDDEAHQQLQGAVTTRRHASIPGFGEETQRRWSLTSGSPPPLLGREARQEPHSDPHRPGQSLVCVGEQTGGEGRAPKPKSSPMVSAMSSSPSSLLLKWLYAESAGCIFGVWKDLAVGEYSVHIYGTQHGVTIVQSSHTIYPRSLQHQP